MTDLAQKLAALSPEKRKLLEQKLKEQGKQFNAFPLSYASNDSGSLISWSREIRLIIFLLPCACRDNSTWRR